ncbi:hypothetical protein BIW11_04645 [Tropilaelaps mercedesae]|uniref:Uncharacterized protein n=1 Tax=Tropilaelaps mercedesae TaxID=418985 RepID=A0A1V9X3S2_9ACAR|nr:hypothetical protein BIW11_04645 [Tropilaelaps mercedesae]
MTFGPPLWLV